MESIEGLAFLMLSSICTSINYSYCVSESGQLVQEYQTFQNLQHFNVQSQLFTCQDQQFSQFAYYDYITHTFKSENLLLTEQPDNLFKTEIRKIIDLKFNLWKFLMKYDDINQKYYKFLVRVSTSSQTDKNRQSKYLYDNVNNYYKIENLRQILLQEPFSIQFPQLNLTYDVDKQINYSFLLLQNEIQQLFNKNILNNIQLEFLDVISKIIENKDYNISFQIFDYENVDGLVYSLVPLTNYVHLDNNLWSYNILVILFNNEQKNLITHVELISKQDNIKTVKSHNSPIQFIYNQPIINNYSNILSLFKSGFSFQIQDIQQNMHISYLSSTFHLFNIYEVQNHLVFDKQCQVESSIQIFDKCIQIDPNQPPFKPTINFIKINNTLYFNTNLTVLAISNNIITLPLSTNLSATLPNANAQIVALSNNTYINLDVETTYNIPFTHKEIIYNNQLILELSFPTAFSGQILLFLGSQKQLNFIIKDQIFYQIIISQFSAIYTVMLVTPSGFDILDLKFDEIPQMSTDILLEKYVQNATENAIIKAVYGPAELAVTKFDFASQIVRNSKFVVDLIFSQIFVFVLVAVLLLR